MRRAARARCTPPRAAAPIAARSESDAARHLWPRSRSEVVASRKCTPSTNASTEVTLTLRRPHDRGVVARPTTHALAARREPRADACDQLELVHGINLVRASVRREAARAAPRSPSCKRTARRWPRAGGGRRQRGERQQPDRVPGHEPGGREQHARASPSRRPRSRRRGSGAGATPVVSSRQRRDHQRQHEQPRACSPRSSAADPPVTEAIPSAQPLRDAPAARAVLVVAEQREAPRARCRRSDHGDRDARRAPRPRRPRAAAPCGRAPISMNGPTHGGRHLHRAGGGGRARPPSGLAARRARPPPRPSTAAR